jgi:hypothetical protein
MPSSKGRGRGAPTNPPPRSCRWGCSSPWPTRAGGWPTSTCWPWPLAPGRSRGCVWASRRCKGWRSPSACLSSVCRVSRPGGAAAGIATRSCCAVGGCLERRGLRRPVRRPRGASPVVAEPDDALRALSGDVLFVGNGCDAHRARLAADGTARFAPIMQPPLAGRSRGWPARGRPAAGDPRPTLPPCVRRPDQSWPVMPGPRT